MHIDGITSLLMAKEGIVGLLLQCFQAPIVPSFYITSIIKKVLGCTHPFAVDTVGQLECDDHSNFAPRADRKTTNSSKNQKAYIEN
jgi:hypothetical protein